MDDDYVPAPPTRKSQYSEPELAARYNLPPRKFAYPALWQASAVTTNPCVTAYYVWAEDGEYRHGMMKPSNAVTVAVFHMDRMTYCIWGDAQWYDELVEETQKNDATDAANKR